MAQQIINVGAAVEDHTGDGLRVAFSKAVANFAELYAKADLLNFDGNGNLIANVTMRTGTYANLITLAGSLGELGVCTDVNAIIKFNGVAGQAKAFFRSRIVQSAECGVAAATIIPTGASYVRVAFFTSAQCGDNFLSGDYGILPAALATGALLRIAGSVKAFYAAGLTKLTMSLWCETATPGVFSNILEQEIQTPNNGVDAMKFDFNMSFNTVGWPGGAQWIAGRRWYMAARHNAAGSVTLVPSVAFNDLQYELKLLT